MSNLPNIRPALDAAVAAAQVLSDASGLRVLLTVLASDAEAGPGVLAYPGEGVQPCLICGEVR